MSTSPLAWLASAEEGSNHLRGGVDSILCVEVGQVNLMSWLSSSSYDGLHRRRVRPTLRSFCRVCLCRSVQMALSVPAKSRSPRQIRAFAIAFARKFTRSNISSCGIRENLRNEPKTQIPLAWKGAFDDYLDAIQKRGAWATYLECFAASASLQRTILVLHDDGKVWEFHRTDEKAAISFY